MLTIFSLLQTTSSSSSSRSPSSGRSESWRGVGEVGTRAAGAEARMAAAAGRKVAVAAVQFACTDVEAENVATAERYGRLHPS
jgi:N-carbamoylputrescine amidase